MRAPRPGSVQVAPALALALVLAAGGCKSPRGAGATDATAGPQRIDLFFTGNVHGEIEPCG